MDFMQRMHRKAHLTRVWKQGLYYSRVHFYITGAEVRLQQRIRAPVTKRCTDDKIPTSVNNAVLHSIKMIE